MRKIGFVAGAAFIAFAGWQAHAATHPEPDTGREVVSVNDTRAEDDYVYEWVDGAYTVEDVPTGVTFVVVAPEGTYTVDWDGSAWVLRPTRAE